MSPSIWYSGKAKLGKTISGGDEERGMNRESTEDFLDSQTILYNTTIVDTHEYIFFRAQSMYNTRSEP